MLLLQTPAQHHYTTTDQELLAIETLKHHHCIIYGCDIIVKTDYKNLNHLNTKHKSVSCMSNYIHWSSMLSQAGADGLSQLSITKNAKIQAQED